MFEIGNSLREARLRQGLDFPEIEQATKIRGKYLRALEEEQFEVLPAQTYVKGFLRSYADHLGLDGQLYVDEFNSRYVRGEIEEEEEQPFRPPSSPSWRRTGSFQGRAVLLTIAVIVGLTVFVFAAAKYGGKNAPSVLNVNPPPPPPKSKPTAKLVVSTPAGRSSYIVVYRGTRGGRPVYQGTLVAAYDAWGTRRSNIRSVTYSADGGEIASDGRLDGHLTLLSANANVSLRTL